MDNNEMPDTSSDTAEVISDAELIRQEANVAEAKIIPDPKTFQPKANKYFTLAMSINGGRECKEFLYCLEDEKFYQYTEGYWRGMGETEFRGILENRMSKMIALPVGSRKQVIENFRGIAQRHADLFNWCEMVNLENGMLNPNTGMLEEHGAMYYSTNRLPYKYDPEAKCELWIKSLNEILENNQQKIGLLQEFFGYCLTRETKQHKALLLLGESRSGKSTILSILSHLVGDANCSSVPLKDVKNSQHTPDLINKIVNIDYDVSVKAVEFEDEFKKITGGEPIRVNQKYVASFSFRPYCKLAMSANIFPKITDHSSAFYTRLMLIPCDRIFSDEEQNRDLPKQLIVELPGILNWVLEGLRRLKKRGKFEQLDFMRDAVEELENENNPTNLFFDDYIEVKADTVTYIDKGELYEHYKRWAERTKNYPLSAARFASCVFKRFHKVTPKNCRLQYGGKRIWRCLQYVEDKKQVGKPVDWAE